MFALPSALAPYGPISLVAFVLVTVGALALAFTFGSLSKRVPGSGGPYVYARDAFGDFGGFLNAGRTGSPPGPATPRSSSRGSGTSRSSGTPGTPSSGPS
ncbi:hypothetical protein [Streptomyces sp. NBC_01477]|uniref:hypothetical protein n=1 Tax=Streptomyces sp. NBC_01477 TaxID=2976015 RepID=UPI0032478F7F